MSANSPGSLTIGESEGGRGGEGEREGGRTGALNRERLRVMEDKGR